MAVSFGAAGTVAYSANNGSSVAPAYPTGITAGQLLVAYVHMKPGTANSGTSTTPSGWTLRHHAPSGGGWGTTLGADTGNTNIWIYSKVADGTETGSLTITVGGNNVCAAQIVRLTKTLSHWDDFAFATGEQITTPTTTLAITTAGNISIASGDFVLALFGIPTDVTTPSQFSAETFTHSGTTFGTVTELGEWDTQTGNDLGGVGAYAQATAGSGTGTFRLGATLTGTLTNVRGPMVVARFRDIALTTVSTSRSTSWNVAEPPPVPVTAARSTSWHVNGPNLLPLDMATGFESGTVADMYNHTGGCTYSSSTDFAKSGTRSLRIDNAGGSVGRISVSTHPTRLMRAIPGRTYTAMYAARAAAGNNVADNTSFMAVLYWHGADGVSIGSTNGTTATLSSTDWTTLTCTAVAPANTAFVRLLIYSDPNKINPCTFYVDEMGLWEGSAAGGWIAPAVNVNLLTLNQATVETDLTGLAASEACTILRQTGGSPTEGLASLRLYQNSAALGYYSVAAVLSAENIAYLNANKGKYFTTTATVVTGTASSTSASVFLSTDQGNFFGEPGAGLPVNTSVWRTALRTVLFNPAADITSGSVIIAITDSSGTGQAYVDRIGLWEGTGTEWYAPTNGLTSVTASRSTSWHVGAISTPLVNTAEGGTDGVTATTGNSGGGSGDAFTVAGTTPPVFSTAAARFGSLGYSIPTGTSVTGSLEWTLPQPDVQASTSFWFNTASTGLAADIRVMAFRNSTPSNLGGLYMSPARRLRLMVNTSGYAINGIESPILTSGSWYLVQLAFKTSQVAANGWFDFKIYNSDLTLFHSASGALPAAVTATGLISRVWYGRPLASDYLGATYFDQLRVDGGRITTISEALLAQVSASSSTLWNVAKTISTATSTLWNSRALVSAVRSSLWNVLATIFGARSTTWNVRSAVSTARSTLWNVFGLASVARALSTSWNVRSTVTDAHSTTWGVRALVGAARSSSWNVRGLIAQAQSTSWHVVGRISKALSSTWTVLRTVPASRSTSWNVRSLVTHTRSTLWNVAGFLATISKAMSTSWHVVGRISAPRSTSWTVRSIVGTSRSTSWTVTRAIATARSTLWNARSYVTQSRSTTWNARSFIAKALSTTWNTRSLVAAQRSTTWTVRTMVAAAVRSTSWNVHMRVSAARSTSWNVLRQITGTGSTLWHTGAWVTSAASTTWNVIGTITSSLSTSWRTLWGLNTPDYKSAKARLALVASKADIRPNSSAAASITQHSRATASIERNAE